MYIRQRHILHTTLLVYKAILSLTGSVIAFLTKDVDRKFRESKEIAWTLYTIMLVNCCFLPLLYFLNIAPDVRFALVVVDILIVVFFSFTFLFVPRLYAALTHNESDYRDNNGIRITKALSNRSAPMVVSKNPTTEE